MIGIDEISFGIFILCILVYITLMMFSRRPGSRARYRVITGIYENWVVNRFRDRNLNVAIQGLRNIIMGNSIYASALLLLLGMLAGLYQSDAFTSGHAFFGIPGLETGLVKISLNALITIFCLFNFMLAIRMMNRLTLLFCAYPQDVDTAEIQGLVIMQEAFNSGQNQLLLGNRGIFYLVPALSWLINPAIFIAISIGVTLHLIFFHDLPKVPAGTAPAAK